MKTIKNSRKNEIIINKSKFICILEYVETRENVLNVLNKYKDIYPGATHYCYGYVLKNTQKCSDDGEPSGTAGKPILNVLLSNNLVNVLCLVIRYFGGIKLGTGGLVRAYSTSVSENLKKTDICTLTNGFNITICFNYENLKTIESLKLDVLKKDYTDKITYNFNISRDDYLDKKNIIDKFITVKTNILIKKN